MGLPPETERSREKWEAAPISCRDLVERNRTVLIYFPGAVVATWC
jgi:hypothetical protein